MCLSPGPGRGSSPFGTAREAGLSEAPPPSPATSALPPLGFLPIQASAQPAHPLLPVLELWSPRNPRRGEWKAWEGPGHLLTPGPPAGASFLSDALLGLERWMSR